MNREKIFFDNQIQLWGLLGPFILSLTFAVILIAPHPHFLYIPLAALIGLPICFYWRPYGFAVAIGILLSMAFYQMTLSWFGALYWDLTLTSAIALTFIVTFLCSHEVAAIIMKKEAEASEQAQILSESEEKLKTIEEKNLEESKIHKEEIEHLKNHYEDLLSTQNDSFLKEKERQIQEQKIAAQAIQKKAQDEILETNNQHENLLQELFRKRNECALLQRRCEEYSAELSLQKNAIEALACSKRNLEEQSKQLETNTLDLKHEIEQLKTLPEAIEEKQRLLCQAQGLYNQLKEQFAEKSQILDMTRRELFISQNELFKQNQEIEELTRYGKGSDTEKELEALLLQMEQEVSISETNDKKELDGLYSLIDHLMNSIIAEKKADSLPKAPKATAIPSKKEKIAKKPESNHPINKKEALQKKKAFSTLQPSEMAAAANKKPAKQKKTTDWANTIFSRWSESHDQSL